MEEEKYQKELFEFEKPKQANFRKFFNIFPKIKFKDRFSIALTSERIVLISIIIIMLMVVIYAAGVETGRRLNKTNLDFSNQPPPRSVVEQPSVVSASPKPKTIVESKIVPSPPKTEIIKEIDKPLTIVAVTFTRKDAAVQEANRLNNKGFDAFVYQSDSYFQVCVGSYINRESAQKILNKIRQQYKDAYIKLR